MAKRSNSRIVTPTSTTNENSSITSETPKRKGRPAGSMREIFVVCSGQYEDTEGEVQLGSEKFHVQIDKDATDLQLLAAGKKMFKDRFGVDPATVLGPFFERKGKSGYTKKRDSVRFDISNADFSDKKATGIYNGWNVSLRYIVNRDDIGVVFYKDEVSPGEKQKAKPGPKAVALKAVSNIKQM